MPLLLKNEPASLVLQDVRNQNARPVFSDKSYHSRLVGFAMRCHFLVLIPVFAISMGSLRAQESSTGHSPGDRIFETHKVHKLHLTISPEQFEKLTPKGGASPFGPPGGPGFGGPAPINQPPKTASEDSPKDATPDTSSGHRNAFGVEFSWAQADVQVNDQTLSTIGVRYKGNFTYMATTGALKKSMKLDFDRFVDDQTLDGLSMVNLHCGVSDPTMSRESMSYQFFRDVGIPAPRTCFAEVYLTVPERYDHEFVGVYTVTEQVNQTFLEEHFGSGKGMLLKPENLMKGPEYLGMNWKDYAAIYDPEGKPSDEQKQRLMKMAHLITHGSDEQFASEIGTFLDVDAFLKFIAANAILSNLDSYLGFGHNYYLYLVPATDKFVFIPWDLDLSLATWPAVGTPEQLVTLSLRHPHAGENRLLDRILANDDFRQRYDAIVREMFEQHFQKDKLLAGLEPIEEALKAPAEREQAAAAKRGEKKGGFGFGGMQFGQSMPPRSFIDQRIESIKAQLSGTSDGYVPKAFGAGFGPR